MDAASVAVMATAAANVGMVGNLTCLNATAPLSGKIRRIVGRGRGSEELFGLPFVLFKVEKTFKTTEIWWMPTAFSWPPPPPMLAWSAT